MPLLPRDLTETERLKLENVALKKALLESQMQLVRDEHTSLVKQLERDRPGWRWQEPQGFVEGDPHE